MTQQEIRKALDFLENKFGYILIEENKNYDFNGEYYYVYKNGSAEKQLEISAGTQYFHCEFRRLTDDTPAAYNDAENCTGYQSLAILESNNNYDPLVYFVGAGSLEQVLENIKALFERNAQFFITSKWIDRARLDYLKLQGLINKFSIEISQEPSFFELAKSALHTKYTPQEYQVNFDNTILPPFHKDRYPNLYSLRRGDSIITLKQRDWRDTPNIYYLHHNDQMLELNLQEYTTDDAVKALINTVENAQ